MSGPAVLSYHGTCVRAVFEDSRVAITTRGRVTFADPLAPGQEERAKTAYKCMVDAAGPVPEGFCREDVMLWWDHSGREVRFGVTDREVP